MLREGYSKLCHKGVKMKRLKWRNEIYIVVIPRLAGQSMPNDEADYPLKAPPAGQFV